MGGIFTPITSAPTPAPNDIIRASRRSSYLGYFGVDAAAVFTRTKPAATLETATKNLLQAVSRRNRLPSRPRHETICAEQQTASASGRIGRNYRQDNMLTVNGGWRSAATRDFGVTGETTNSQR